MTLKDDMKDYQSRCANVNDFIAEERRTASIELRWRQLNAAYGMAKGLGLIKEDPSEMEVYERWAKIKEKFTNRFQKP